MATWVDPVDSQTDPDAPITSDLAKRWDNNVIALSEGAPGAPSMYVGLAERMTAGGLGTWVFASRTSGDVNFGAIVAGSTLRPTASIRGYVGTYSASNELALGSALTGSWMCLGRYTHSVRVSAGGGSDADRTIYGATLWMRVV